MYGHIHVILKDLVISKFGPESWRTVLHAAGYGDDAKVLDTVPHPDAAPRLYNKSTCPSFVRKKPTREAKEILLALRVLLHLLRRCKLGWFWGVSDPFSGGTYWTLRVAMLVCVVELLRSPSVC